MFLAALLIGVAAGLRSMTAPFAVSVAARLGWLRLEGTALGFLASPAVPWVFGVLAAGEWIADKLPKTPSRKAPPGFAARVVSGALCGAAIGANSGALALGLAAGVAGAVLGTLGGYEARRRLARAAGRDLPIALLEDFVAIVLAFAATGAVR